MACPVESLISTAFLPVDNLLGDMHIQVSDKRIADPNSFVARTNGKCYHGDQNIPRESKYSLERTCKTSII